MQTLSRMHHALSHTGRIPTISTIMAAENAAAVPPVPADPKHQLDPADNLAAFALVDETCYTLVCICIYIYVCVCLNNVL